MDLWGATTKRRMPTSFDLWSVVRCVALIAIFGGQLSAFPINCSTWQLVNPLPVDRDLHAVAHRDGKYVIVGDEGTILISENQVGWLRVTPPTDRNLNSVIGHPEGFSCGRR